MHTELMKKATQAHEFYKRLNYEHTEGLIPDDLYLKQLVVIRQYLESIYEQMDQIAKRLQEEQNDR